MREAKEKTKPINRPRGPKGKPLFKVEGMNERNNGEKNRIVKKERPNGPRWTPRKG